MKRGKVKNKCPHKRHIEDCPFYNYQYKHDELPLDPAKPFIMELVGKYLFTNIFLYKFCV